MKTKTKSRGLTQAKFLSDGFDGFVRQVCALSPKVGVELYKPIEESGDALLYTPVRSPKSANVAFDPKAGKWVHCEMLAAEYMNFCLGYSGVNKTIYPVPEAGERMEFLLPVQSAASVSEVLEFYFSAAKNCRASIKPVSRPLSELLERVFVVVWMDRTPKLLPLDDVRIHERLPKIFLNYLAAFLRNDMDEVIRIGGTFWGDLCGEHKKQLRRLRLESPEVNDLTASTSDLRFRVSSLGDLPVGILAREYPHVVLRVNRLRSSQLFCEEFLSHITEGARAVRDCLRGPEPLSDLPRRIARTRVVLPDSRMGQIRYAMELRATRHVAGNKFEGMIGKPEPLADAVRASRAVLRKLEKLHSPAMKF